MDRPPDASSLQFLENAGVGRNADHLRIDWLVRSGLKFLDSL